MDRAWRSFCQICHTPDRMRREPQRQLLECSARPQHVSHASLSCSDPPQRDSHRCPATEAVIVAKLKTEGAVAGDCAIRPCSAHGRSVRSISTLSSWLRTTLGTHRGRHRRPRPWSGCRLRRFILDRAERSQFGPQVDLGDLGFEYMVTVTSFR